MDDEELGNTDDQDQDIESAESDIDEVAVPEKSKFRYEQQYEAFRKWQEDRGMAGDFSENVLMSFFDELSTKRSPSTLWSTYSMVRSTIHFHNKIDISKHKNLLQFLKSKNNGYVVPKPKIFTDEQVNKFIDEAPDHLYLATKVVLIFSLMGACKTDELVEMSYSQIETHGRVYLVRVPAQHSKTERTFTISDHYFDLVEKYIKLRPSAVISDRFFLNYQKGKCTVQFIGKNKFTQIPKQIANYLGLEEADRYTGHSIRKTLTTVFSNVAGKKRRSSPRYAASTSGNRITRSQGGKKIKRSKSNEDSSDDSDTTSCSSFEDETNPLSPLPNESSPTISKAFSLSDPLNEEGDQSSSNNTTKNRMDLINKHFTFENCTNVYITFK